MEVDIEKALNLVKENSNIRAYRRNHYHSFALNYSNEISGCRMSCEGILAFHR